MADDDHSQQPRCRRHRRDNRGGNDRGGSCSDTTIASPHGSDGYTPWPLYLDPRADTIQMWLGSVGEGGGVDVQQPLPSAMLADALPYVLPPQQATLTFAPPLVHVPPAAWPPWMTPDALPYSLPP
jgi:hypothetical protein